MKIVVSAEFLYGFLYEYFSIDGLRAICDYMAEYGDYDVMLGDIRLMFHESETKEEPDMDDYLLAELPNGHFLYMD